MIAPKRFWTEVHVAETPGGLGVRLDARVLRTPAKAELVVPTRALAEAIAAEWRAVEGEIRPEAMPFTRAANVAVDRIAADPGPLVAHLASYGETDLLCYRAEAPVGLRARQAAAWDPALAWAARDLGAPLAVTEGVAHRAQDPASLAALHAAVGAHDAFALTALSELVTLLRLAGPGPRRRARGAGRARGLGGLAAGRDLAGRAVGRRRRGGGDGAYSGKRFSSRGQAARIAGRWAGCSGAALTIR